MLRFDIWLKSPLRGHPFLFLSSPFPPAPPQFLVWLGSFIAMGMGRTVASTCFTSAAGSGQDQLCGNTVGTSACGEERVGDRGVRWLAWMILSCVETVGFHLKVDEMGVNVGCYFVPSCSSPFCLPGALAYNNINGKTSLRLSSKDSAGLGIILLSMFTIAMTSAFITCLWLPSQKSVITISKIRDYHLENCISSSCML